VIKKNPEEQEHQYNTSSRYLKEKPFPDEPYSSSGKGFSFFLFVCQEPQERQRVEQNPLLFIPLSNQFFANLFF
jgi:hypothetical protein